MPIPRAWSAPRGSPSIWPTPTFGSSTPAINLPMQNRSARAEIRASSISRAPGSSTSMRSADSESTLPHAAGARRNSPRGYASSGRGSATATASSSTIPRACFQRGAGLVEAFVSSAIRTWPCWTAGCRNGWPRAVPSTISRRSLRERHFTARFDHSQLRNKGPDAGQYREQAWPGARRPIRRPLPRPRA